MTWVPIMITEHFFLHLFFFERNCINKPSSIKLFFFKILGMSISWSYNSRITTSNVTNINILLRIFAVTFLLTCVYIFIGLPWWCSGQRIWLLKQRQGFNPWLRKIHWRRKWQPIPVFLPGKSHGQKSLRDYSLEGCKESDTTEHACCL